MQVNITGGDITTVTSDVLITAINSSGMWFGGIDGAIQGVAGGMFHSQAAQRMPLADGDVVYAPAPGGFSGQFNSVIFVVDNLRRPLHQIVLAGLWEADRQHKALVSLPSLRTGVMAGAYERTVEAALDETAAAIIEFRNSQPQFVQQLNVVVFRDPHCERYLADKVAV